MINKLKILTLLLSFFLTVFVCLSSVSAQNSIDSIPKQEEKQSLVLRMFSAYTNNLNYYTVTALMAVEGSCFIPFPSEVVVPPAAYQACNPDNKKLYVSDSLWLNISLVIFFATLGALLGGVVSYYFAFFVGRPFIYWFVETKIGHLCLLNAEKVQKAEKIFVKNGSIAIFICRLIPGIRQIISVPAGLAKMKMRPFLLYTFLGAGLWNVVLALLGYFAHGQQDIINRFGSEISYIILALVVLFGIYLFYKVFLKKKSEN
jgi:membrane protein DedA with SNARE-associated domain